MTKWIVNLTVALFIFGVLIMGLYLIVMNDPTLGRRACEEHGGTWKQSVEHCYNYEE